MEAVLADPNVDTLPQLDILAENRRQFVDALVQKALIGTEFAESGVLEQFDIDQKTGVDALPHILVGDRTGGFHHAPSAASLGLSRTIGSWTYNPDASMKAVPWQEQYLTLKVKQTVRQTGVYYAKRIGFGTGEVDPGTGEERIRLKSGGSNMFPDEWTAQQVLLAIVETVNTGSKRLAKEGDRYIYNQTINGVPIQAMTQVSNGKILIAYPVKET